MTIFSPSSAIFGLDEIVDRLVGILDESLLEQTNRAVKFVEFSVDNFVDDVGRFAFHLRLVNRALGFDQIFAGTSSRLT